MMRPRGTGQLGLRHPDLCPYPNHRTFHSSKETAPPLEVAPAPLCGTAAAHLPFVSTDGAETAGRSTGQCACNNMSVNGVEPGNWLVREGGVPAPQVIAAMPLLQNVSARSICASCLVL